MIKPDKVFYELWNCPAELQEYHPEYRTGIVFTESKLESALTHFYKNSYTDFSCIKRCWLDPDGDIYSEWKTKYNTEELEYLSYKKIELFL